ncbi:MAG TPA: hypothetical protein VFI72_06900 [Candidatus Angelobacter sp.]|nr:hypothetical protein [Candidatus Angelobacter sp.]
MTKALAVPFLCLLLALPGYAQQAQPPSAAQPQQVQPDLGLIISQIQRVALATNGDLGKLRIEKWKADSEQKQQMQKVVDSLQRNITYAIPGLVADVQSTKGNVSSTFKLYHNLNVVYEFLSSLAEAAGAYGKKDEYEPLVNDATALDSARQNLSSYIEHAASNYEASLRARQEAAAAAAAQKTAPKVIVDDEPPPKKPARKSTKKKSAGSSKASPKASPTPTPSPK